MDVIVDNLSVKVSLYRHGTHQLHRRGSIIDSIKNKVHKIGEWFTVTSHEIKDAADDTIGSISGFFRNLPNAIIRGVADVAPIFPLNTDGIDPSGVNILIRNLTYIGYDDAVAVKPSNSGSKYGRCTKNVVVDGATVKWSTGMAVGTVPSRLSNNCITDVTFRNVKMNKPFKAIYIKSNPGDVNGTGSITNILYENFQVTGAIWWPIYIGPQQQQQPDGGGPGCMTFPLKHCPTNPLVSMRNITLRNIDMQDTIAIYSGAIRCNRANPCTEFHFQNVNVVPNKSIIRLNKKFRYYCENISGTSRDVSPNLCF